MEPHRPSLASAPCIPASLRRGHALPAGRSHNASRRTPTAARLLGRAGSIPLRATKNESGERKLPVLATWGSSPRGEGESKGKRRDGLLREKGRRERIAVSPPCCGILNSLRARSAPIFFEARPRRDEPAPGCPEPRPARGGDARRITRAGSGRGGLGEDPRHSSSHRLPAHGEARLGPQHPRRDLHEQGGAGNEGAGLPPPEQRRPALPVDGHVSRHLRAPPEGGRGSPRRTAHPRFHDP